MGTIVIEQYASVGTSKDSVAPLADLGSLKKKTIDATTSTSAESLVIDDLVTFVRIYATEKHRVCLGSDTTSSIYADCIAGEAMEFAVSSGVALYYRLDA